MIKKTVKKITAIILGIGLCFSQFGSPVFAAENQDNQQNDQTTIQSIINNENQAQAIYVITDTDGTTKKVIVNDEIKTALKNAKGISDKALTEKNNAKCFDIDGNPLSWINNVENEMPIALSVRYTLDGNDISAEDLIGKSGHVKITYHYDNHQFQNINGIRTAVPFTVITGLIVNDAVFSNIKVSNGKCVDSGKQTIIVGLAMPGLQSDLNLDSSIIALPDEVTIEGDAVNFELDSAMTLVTNELFSGLEPASLNSISSMLSATDSLSSNMNTIIDGASELSGGLGTLMAKSADLVDAVDQLSDGTAALALGADQLDVGIDRVQEGVNDLSDGLNTLSESGQELSSAGQTIFDVFLKACNFVLPLLPKFPEEYKPMTADNYAIVLDKIAECYGKILPHLKDTTDGLKKIGQFAQGICAYTAAVDLAAEGAAQLQEGMVELKYGSTALSDGLNTLNGGTQELKSQSPQFVDGIKKLNNGGIQLSDGLKQFNRQGIEKIVNLLKNDVGGLLDRFRATVNAAKQYRAFDGITPLEGQVNYIYKTEAIKHKN